MILFHTAFRAKVTRNTLKTRRITCKRRNTAARSFIITAVENQTLLLSCIGAKIAVKTLLSRFYFQAAQKNILLHPSNKMTKSFCLILAKFVFLDRFSCKSLFPLYTKIHLWGEALIHGDWQKDMKNVTGAFRMSASDRIVELQHFAFMPNMNVTYVLFPTL